MALTRLQNDYFTAESRRAHSKFRLRVGLAHTLEDLRAAQRLRYRVFVEEMGARVPVADAGIESDRFDHYCQHLLVRDNRSGQVVGCYRILTDSQAARAGGYYSQTEFDLTRIFTIPGRFVEVGRTCVHPDYRTGAVIGLLWSGLARFMLMHRYDYLMGCASIPLTDSPGAADAVWQAVRAKHLGPPEWRVFPKTPLPSFAPPSAGIRPDLPALLKGYLRLGAQVCGDPAWDPVFNTADLFLLLGIDRISARYAQHFIRRGT
jgi:putative hemolysin